MQPEGTLLLAGISSSLPPLPPSLSMAVNLEILEASETLVYQLSDCSHGALDRQILHNPIIFILLFALLFCFTVFCL